MATTSDVKVSESLNPTKSIAAYSFIEDTESKTLQRVSINDSNGADILGSKTDAASIAYDATAASHIALLKGIISLLQSGIVNSVKTWVSAGDGEYQVAVTSTTGQSTKHAVPSGTLRAQITWEKGNVRRTSDGSEPTISNGTLLQDGESYMDDGPLTAYQYFAVSGSPVFTAEYFK